MAYLIGDTIRLKATVKNLDGDEEAPGSITVSVYRADGETLLLDSGVPTLTDGTTAQYYYDWEISGITVAEDLTAVWEWSGPHKKTFSFTVELAL